jgi:hypothetical protein
VKRENTLGAYRMRSSVLLMAALVLSLTVVCVRRAYAAVTVPNFVEYTFTVAAGADSPVMYVPYSTTNPRPVVITGICTTVPYRGCGFVHAYYGYAAPAVLHWAGVRAANNNGLTTAQNYTHVGGTDICAIGYDGAAVLRTGTGPSNILIHNNNANSLTCKVTMTY